MRSLVPNLKKGLKMKKVGGSGGVKQMRGPGENLGLKKPRVGGSHVPKAAPFDLNAELGRQAHPAKGSRGVTGAYLPKFSKGGKVVK